MSAARDSNKRLKWVVPEEEFSDSEASTLSARVDSPPAGLEPSPSVKVKLAAESASDSVLMIIGQYIGSAGSAAVGAGEDRVSAWSVALSSGAVAGFDGVAAGGVAGVTSSFSSSTSSDMRDV